MITSEEVAAVIRQALTGAVPVRRLRPDGETWDECFAGDLWFCFGDWQIAFFNDCDQVDYVAEAQAPDGRRCEYQEPDAVELLSREEEKALEQLLKAA